MIAFWKAVWGRVLAASYDVLLIAFFSLVPVLLGRFIDQARNPNAGAYFDFFTNGQLAFYSMGSLAGLLVMCFSDSLGKGSRKAIGAWSVICLIFTAGLVGIDPSLTASSYTPFGPIILGIYISTLIVKIYAEAVKRVDNGQLAKASGEDAKREIDSFKVRMKGRSQ